MLGWYSWLGEVPQPGVSSPARFTGSLILLDPTQVYQSLWMQEIKDKLFLY
jgi:hypothetical protein